MFKIDPSVKIWPPVEVWSHVNYLLNRIEPYYILYFKNWALYSSLHECKTYNSYGVRGVYFQRCNLTPSSPVEVKRKPFGQFQLQYYDK